MHQWATAVEAYDLINSAKDRTKRALTAETPAAVFFMWASAALCKIEGTPPPPRTSDFDSEIAANLQTEAARDVIERLKFASDSVVVIARAKEMVGTDGSVLVWLQKSQTGALERYEQRFWNHESEKARTRLKEEESDTQNVAAVLIEIEHVEQAKEALLGYYLNTTEFRQTLESFCSAHSR
jgi:hypothetical protein